MPRKGAGAAGNRSDLPSKLPASVVPSKQYGQAAQELAMQQKVPMASGDITPSGGPPPSAGPPPGMGGPPPGPGEVQPLDAPTDRPNEPITHGLPSGPGGGPEALRPPDPLVKAAAVLNQMGGSADAGTQKMRAIINAHLANQGAE